MEFIKPTVEIWDQNDIWEHIARCTRVCYQSTPKDDKETNEEFVKRVILRNGTENNFDKLHGAMLEHGTVYLKFYSYEFDKGYNPGTKYADNKYSKATYNYDYQCWYITTNLRVIYENGWLYDLQYLCLPTKHHAKRVTVCFTTNIGVTREFNRHRVNSIAEESTRYCNYNKRNDSQLKIVPPAWLLGIEYLPYMVGHSLDTVGDYASGILAQEDDEIVKTWCDMDFYLCALTFAQWCYNMLIKKGWKPQQAREVLPLATKSQLIHTAFIDDWVHFFKLRAIGTSGAPHPNAKLIAEPLYKEFVKRGYIKELV